MTIWVCDIHQTVICVNCSTQSTKVCAVLEAHTCYIVILFSPEKGSFKSFWGFLQARQLRDTLFKLGLEMSAWHAGMCYKWLVSELQFHFGLTLKKSEKEIFPVEKIPSHKWSKASRAVGWFMSAYIVKDLERTRLKYRKDIWGKRPMWMAIHLGMSTPCENFHDPHKQAPLLRKVSGEIPLCRCGQYLCCHLILTNRFLNKVAMMAGMSSK